MKYLTLIVIALLSFQSGFGQELSGTELLKKAIKYHDPNGQWSSFNGQLQVVMETPNNPNRHSKIKINLPKDYFCVSATRDTINTEYTVDHGACSIKLNGSEAISEAEQKMYNLSCDRATLYKNYYTYLYGLPMKLKDEGTIIHDAIERRTFKGKEYLVLKVSYDKNVGSDVWFFYFDPETYAMEIYQFYKTDENGKLKKDSGEYILLTETMTINMIKMPKNRAWYYNKDDKYLGTDKLQE
ncbi:hypothetical protein SAMN04515667_0294 [Formosa sp. Hel1_31_208]|uniref:DUF6503 family protein n=1 Tax=Formosa sp. Hel1_31_208 TaxID=1798225 RepID=UPI00087ADDB9|nr:DUF6503 family protein [Formosa sp. Hel1_31_208]SDR68744.1 hypothetical protein SAMN04515667_0294 [Formosa sp. Hel1_31_208]